MRPPVFGRYEVHVVDALLHQPHRGGEERVVVIDGSDVLRRELMILAEEAAAGASREEERSRAAGARDGRLLAAMRQDGAELQAVVLSAEASLARRSVCASLAGAEGAMGVWRGHRHAYYFLMNNGMVTRIIPISPKMSLSWFIGHHFSWMNTDSSG